eukprot:CAMPEP_0184508932 /NCGR_PEP_ID=MMETSP0198_2-20121128/1017_1 /TAXON_ID=1112570 /ORGANISM="Thraustochytrium sp., Strain LLF1b" /LENGTH=119 /DNA_ID=CAMNT_0026898735 /DNA_START=538 /DNA_END=897 /DNA_ORIENTATION=-
MSIAFISWVTRSFSAASTTSTRTSLFASVFSPGPRTATARSSTPGRFQACSAAYAPQSLNPPFLPNTTATRTTGTSVVIITCPTETRAPRPCLLRLRHLRSAATSPLCYLYAVQDLRAS